MNPTYRRGLVRAALGTVQQRLEVALQVRRILRGRLPVNADRPVLAGQPEGFLEPVKVDVMRQRGEGHRGSLPRQCRYPLSFR